MTVEANEGVDLYHFGTKPYCIFKLRKKIGREHCV